MGNQILARLASSLARIYNLPIIAQEEVADALGRDRCIFVAGGSPTGASTVDWNTRKVAELQADFGKKQGYDTVIVIAGPFHIGRAKWCYESLDLQTLVGWRVRSSTYQDPTLIHFPMKSPWFLPLVWLREQLARLDFVRRGWM